MSYLLLQGDESKALRAAFALGTIRTAGDIVVVEGRLFVVLNDVTATEVPVGYYATDEHGITLPKATGVINPFEVVHWDENGVPVGGSTTGAITTTATGNIRVGRAPLAGLSGDASIAVELIQDHVQQA